jgi:hypothetical protein
VPVYTWSGLKHGWANLLPYQYRPYIWPAAAAVAAFGIYWFIMGAARSRGYRDYRIIMRSMVKTGVGVALLYSEINNMLVEPHEYYAWGIYFGVMIGTGILVAGWWCVITGLVKIGLALRGPPRIRLDPNIDDMPHGGATYGTGFDE